MHIAISLYSHGCIRGKTTLLSNEKDQKLYFEMQGLDGNAKLLVHGV